MYVGFLQWEKKTNYGFIIYTYSQDDNITSITSIIATINISTNITSDAPSRKPLQLSRFTELL